MVYAIEGLASLHCDQNQPEYTACLFGWADAMRAKIGDPRPSSEQADMDKDIAVIVAKIGSSAFEVAYDSGRGTTMDEAVALGSSSS